MPSAWSLGSRTPPLFWVTHLGCILEIMFNMRGQHLWRDRDFHYHFQTTGKEVTFKMLGTEQTSLRSAVFNEKCPKCLKMPLYFHGSAFEVKSLMVEEKVTFSESSQCPRQDCDINFLMSLSIRLSQINLLTTYLSANFSLMNRILLLHTPMASWSFAVYHIKTNENNLLLFNNQT